MLHISHTTVDFLIGAVAVVALLSVILPVIFKFIKLNWNFNPKHGKTPTRMTLTMSDGEIIILDRTSEDYLDTVIKTIDKFLDNKPVTDGK